MELYRWDVAYGTEEQENLIYRRGYISSEVRCSWLTASEAQAIYAKPFQIAKPDITYQKLAILSIEVESVGVWGLDF